MFGSRGFRAGKFASDFQLPVGSIKIENDEGRSFYPHHGERCGNSSKI